MSLGTALPCSDRLKMADSTDLLINGKQLSSLRVVDLKSELDKRGLSKTGSKKELLDRLKACLLEETKEDNEMVQEDDCIPNMKADAIAEDNDFIKEYLAKQQEQYKAQKQEKIRVQEEEELRASTGTEEDGEEDKEVEESNKRRKKRSARDSQISSCSDESGKMESVEMTLKDTSKDSPSSAKESETRRRSRRSSAKSHDSLNDTPVETSMTVLSPVLTTTPDNKKSNSAPVVSSTASTSDTLETHHTKSDDPGMITRSRPDDTKVHIDNIQDEEVNLSSGVVGWGVVGDRVASSSTADTHGSHQGLDTHREVSKDGGGEGVDKKEGLTGNGEKVPSSTNGAAECSNVSTSANTSAAAQLADANSAAQPVNNGSTEESGGRPDLGSDAMELDISIEEKDMDLMEKDISASNKKGCNKEATEGPAIRMEIQSGDQSKEEKRKSRSSSGPDKINDIRDSRVEAPSSQRHSSRRHSRGDDRDRDRKFDTKSGRQEDKENKEGSSGERPVRKRKWGSSSSSAPVAKKPSLSISTDSLKNIIPDVTLETADLHSCDSSPTERKHVVENFESPGVGSGEPARKVITADNGTIVGQRVRSVSPARRPLSNILHITNLVRPFTVPQLKELLSRWGVLEEETFWIDKIKSKCYVMYQNQEEAKEARQSLHGIRWPSSNPKVLRVEFATLEDVDYHRKLENNEITPTHIEPFDARGSREQNERTKRDEKKDKEREKEREKRLKGPVREWDRDKIGERSPGEKEREKERERERERERRKKEREEKEKDTNKKLKEEEEAPSKLLDDLFKKTKGTPCIYWLPLTSEQIAEKEELRRQRMAERERRLAEIEKVEKDRAEAQRVERDQRRQRVDGHGGRSPNRRRK